MKKILALVAAVAATLTATAGAAQSPTSAWDKEWLKTGLAGDRFEIAGGRLALQHSSNREVRILAQRLIRDHTKSLGEGAKLAPSIGVKVPSKPLPTMQWELKTSPVCRGPRSTVPTPASR
jgi:putative membrane protein